jgi:DNA-binding NtrC family response regulator
LFIQKPFTKDRLLVTVANALKRPDGGTLFLDYDWPGNVRELQNVMENIVIMNRGKQITLEMLPESFPRSLAAARVLQLP